MHQIQNQTQRGQEIKQEKHKIINAKPKVNNVSFEMVEKPRRGVELAS